MADLLPYIRAHSRNAVGARTFGQADDDVLDSGIASLSKVMVNWVARQWLPSDADLDQQWTCTAVREGPRIFAGDVVTVRDLMFLAAVPSDNAAPMQIAQMVGQAILDAEGGTGDPNARFAQEMQDEADRLGYDGAGAFSGTVNNADMSAAQVSDLFARSLADPALRAMYEATQHNVQVSGPQARTIPVEHTIRTAGIALPDVVSAKTGSYQGRHHVVVSWVHPSGVEHVTTILNADADPPTERYTELLKVIEATSAIHPVTEDGLKVPFVIDAVTETGMVEAHNGGNTSAPATLRIDGPVQNPTVRHIETGATLTFNLSLSAEQWLEVDLDARTVLLNGQSSRRGLMRGQWFDLAPGHNRLMFNAADSNPTAQLTVTWADAYR